MNDQYWWQRLLNVIAWFGRLSMWIIGIGGILSGVSGWLQDDPEEAWGIIIGPILGFAVYVGTIFLRKVINYIVLSEN